MRPDAAPIPPSGHDRREFIRRGVLAVAAAAVPTRLPAASSDLTGRPADEDFWKLVRTHFLIPHERIYLNVGTLGAQPRSVVDTVEHVTVRVAESLPPGVDWAALEDRIGRLLNGDPRGFCFPRNTTEAMNFVANGLELRDGDEVLTTRHEHIGGLCCWQLLAARRGVLLKQLDLPTPPRSADEVIDIFKRALAPRTRVVSISHLTFTTGLVMPVAGIARMCRERGIICVVDGAHPPGMMPVDLRAIDADFYASSPHKWLLAPQGSGFLYMRDEWRTRLWPTIASGGWDDLSLGARRFNHLGTIDESRLHGLDAALAFYEMVGPDRVHARIEELRRRIDAGVRSLPRATVGTPEPGPLAAGMVSFRLAGVDSLEMQRSLAQRHVRTRVISEYGYGWMRLSPHVYVSPGEVDAVVGMIGEAAGDRRR